MIRTTTRKSSGPMNKQQAAALTERIRKAVDGLWELLLQAHEQKAWKALGYGAWEEYVKAEFGMSRSRSYQLLDQGRAIEAIREATGDLSTSVDISEAEARDIKPDLPAVTEGIKVRIEKGEDPKTAAKEVIDATRDAKAKARAEKKAKQAENDALRDQHREALPPAVKAQEQAKAEAIAKRKSKAVDVEALTAELEELREANEALEADLAALRAEHVKWEDMRVQWEMGGYEKVVDGLKAEIGVLQSRLYRESEDKASWMRSAKYWQEEAKKLGWSRDEVIDIETGEFVNG